MLGVLVIHIAAVLLWCATLLYLPLYIIINDSGDIPLTPPGDRGSVTRFVFTNIASPAALIAIITGTIVFLISHAIAFWLIVKLTLVSVLVVLHALTGLFLLKINNDPDMPVLPKSVFLAGALCILMVTIIATVLTKPAIGVFP